VYPSFYVNFTRTCLQQPRSVVSVMPCALQLCIFHTHMAAAAIAEGSCLLRAWSGCSVITGVLTATHEFWCNPRRHCCRCPGTGSTWHKSCLTLHTCLLHTLCCCKLVLAVAWVQGSRSNADTRGVNNLDTAVPGSRHTAHALCGWVMLYSPRKVQQVLLQACAHLFVTATEF
jgi:hypothetical protein